MSVRRLIVCAGIAMGLGTAGMPLAAQAPEMIRACVSSPRGNVRIVAAGEACVQSERPVQWPSTAPAGGGPLRVLDAGGNFVAWLMSAGTFFPNALMRVEDHWVGLGITADSASGLGEVEFHYSTPCPANGALHGFPGHIRVTLPTMARPAGALQSTPGVVYYAGDIDPTFTPVSFEARAFGPTARSCQPGGPSLPGWKYAHSVSLDVSSFQAPFRISQ